MYNNEYEEYMKSVLGYPIQYENNTYSTNQYTDNTAFFPYRYNNNFNINFESMYPEIYNILQPMIQKACNNTNYRNFSNDTLEYLTDEIYSTIETNENLNIVNVNVRTQEADELLKKDIKISSREKNMSISERNNSKENTIQDNSTKKQEAESRSYSNSTLRDLIKILLLNQIINNNQNKPQIPPPRPPIQQLPPRPMYRGELENLTLYNNTPNQPYQFF